MPLWSVPREWEGQTAFIVAGGPSVATQNLELLRGKNVIAINSSWPVVPFAQYLFFGDKRWWIENWDRVKEFSGKIVTVVELKDAPQVLWCRKYGPKDFGLSPGPQWLCMRRTSLTAAIELARHLGCARGVLLGADGRASQDGKTHHHKPHKWPQKPGCWDEQRKDLQAIAGPLQACGFEVLNASPGSAINLWPHVNLSDVL